MSNHWNTEAKLMAILRVPGTPEELASADRVAARVHDARPPLPAWRRRHVQVAALVLAAVVTTGTVVPLSLAGSGQRTPGAAAGSTVPKLKHGTSANSHPTHRAAPSPNPPQIEVGIALLPVSGTAATTPLQSSVPVRPRSSLIAIPPEQLSTTIWSQRTTVTIGDPATLTVPPLPFIVTVRTPPLTIHVPPLRQGAVTPSAVTPLVSTVASVPSQTVTVSGVGDKGQPISATVTLPSATANVILPPTHVQVIVPPSTRSTPAREAVVRITSALVSAQLPAVPATVTLPAGAATPTANGHWPVSVAPAVSSPTSVAASSASTSGGEALPASPTTEAPAGASPPAPTIPPTSSSPAPTPTTAPTIPPPSSSPGPRPTTAPTTPPPTSSPGPRPTTPPTSAPPVPPASVSGPGTQLGALYRTVQGIGPGQSLASKVAEAESKLASGDIGGTCGALGAFISEVKAQSSKQVPPSTANQLIADAQSIQAGLAC